MKKKKWLRNVSLVGLSAIMACGVAFGAAGCGSSDPTDPSNPSGPNRPQPGSNGVLSDSKPNELSVSIFCNEADAATNRKICNDWAAAYGAAIGKTITIDFKFNTDKDNYYNVLANVWQNPESVADIIYLAPRYVKAYAEAGRIVDLTDYLTQIDGATDNLQGLWGNSLNYYGYIPGTSGENKYTMGQSISYNANGADGAGFYTSNNQKAGLYALPKDYSNFSTGYNRRFFQAGLKEAYTTTLATTARNVSGAVGEGGKGNGEYSSSRRYSATTGAKGRKSCIVYATSGEYVNRYTGATMRAAEGEPAPIINVGVPTTYYPFNFFRFNSYDEAIAGGDPVALLCDEYTDGAGYTVTIPGFPDETFKIDDPNYQNTNAPYDYTMGHITYTYAEYSALLWALTYYLNTFGVFESNGALSQDPTSGTGGIPITTGGSTEYNVIYAGEQYEGALGSPLYLLPWLASNDADLIDATSSYCAQYTRGKDANGNKIKDEPTVPLDAADLAITNPAAWRDVAGNDSDVESRQTINGNPITRNVQYGYNSENFIETFGAFLALSSDWNGNPMGDADTRSGSTNGWSYFRAGRSIFYGAGSWDSATRNDVDYNVLQFGQMPTPIAEKYALYSYIKGANYEMQEYSNDPADIESATSYGDKQRDNKAEGKARPYTYAEVVANQCKRQDKWAARMDSVGFAVTDKEGMTGKLYDENSAWKRAGAAALCYELTSQKAPQVTLTYGGAQLPNFRVQCEEFFNYQSAANANGDFKDMITPEGFATTQYYDANGDVNPAGKAEAEQIWNAYYNLARAMASKAKSGTAGTQTVGQFIESYAWNGNSVIGTSVKYDEQYKDTPLADTVTSTTTGLAFAMKILRMVSYTRSDRDLNIRMQYGLNAVNDSSMYTFNSDWLGDLDSRQNSKILAYLQQKPVSGATLLGKIQTNPASAGTTSYITPAVFCFLYTKIADEHLYDAIKQESSSIKG